MKIKKYLLLLASLGMLVTACDNYIDINKNTTGVTDGELEAGGLIYGTQLMEMQQRVIPIGSPTSTTGPGNDLAVTDVMSSGQYVGYFGLNNNWKMATEATWDFTDNRMHYAYEQLYMRVYQPWVQIYQKIGSSEDVEKQEIMSIFNIVRVAGWLRATDCFGPIVYSNAGKGSLAPDPDKQEDVYKNMLRDLEGCVGILNKATSKIMPQYDLIYNGDPVKWVKLANSLMLRMAVRVRYVSPELAKEYVKKALDANNGGCIEAKADEAKIGNSTKMPLLNSLIATIDYKESRMGATAWSYLIGYQDPRVGSYYTQGVHHGEEGYYALAPGNTEGKGEGENSAEFASAPKVANSDPLYWFRASEVYFLKAEAALFNLIDGDVKMLYEAGVKMSMDEWGVNSEAVTAYLNKEDMPAEIGVYSYYYGNYSSSIKENNVPPKWNNESSQEKKLQQIITQKYLALYPNGVEAWTEYRRTGYPYLMALYDSTFPDKIGADATARAPERFKFSADEYKGNEEGMQQITNLVGGPDKGGTKLWWVRPDRPVQR
ncbi:SusD/RagB family nutrient-binding outer membrane lipoprotein [Bacteroides ovatus]|uniref:SusD/RagB family nutrient-binding outer membrane lipoprotein n=2 Tax=Bacteroides ovatus TaxID=28116 RepID=A0AAW6IGA3_BACOV|nr:SusD/RagB family nutrient-binding outer membrane lipoprotein [Bacteroides ovatus]MCS2613716.1 SusD/RagB family nutrient-binding outer membrane lipoprotein [Bacteroides fragilis]MCS2877143.1 SusD/RagB family nutrient-binding outer membrane lipoprotein [Bacteroides fragilis]MDC7959593.1 SusD/RagB family nutrient-binding outer membrane lipoprotein [Bacteroides ovatus]